MSAEAICPICGATVFYGVRPGQYQTSSRVRECDRCLEAEVKDADASTS